MRRSLASAASISLALGLLVGLGPPSNASTNLGTVTVNYVSSGGSGTWTIVPSSLSGSVGDTFVLLNQRDSDNNRADTFVSLQNDSGSVSIGATSCTGTGTCAVLDTTATPRNSATFTISSGGTIRVIRSNRGSVSQIGTLTITSSSSGGGVVPTPSYTASADPNGGSCSGNMSWTRIPSIEAFAGVFALPTASACSRTNFALAGWSSSANATKPEFEPGATYTMGDSDVMLFAVWRPVGVEVVYDANVGLETQCIAGGTNLTTAAERRSKATVVAVGSATATTAPCSPTGLALTGWALTGDGASVAAAGAALPPALTSGSSVTLYAKWSVPAPAVERKIIISGDRGLVAGKPGISIDGGTTGFVAGARVVPYIRFPGMTSYEAGSARPEVGADGSFFWERKTGKKTYVYFTSQDGSVTSNRVIIPAR